MTHMGRQQEHRAFTQVDTARRAVVDDLEPGVALELPKEFLVRIVVIIRAPVRPAHHRDDEVGIFPNLLVAYGRLQQMLVLGEPLGEIDRRQHKRIMVHTAERDNRTDIAEMHPPLVAARRGLRISFLSVVVGVAM